MKRYVLILLVIIFFTGHSFPLLSQSGYILYTNGKYNYEIILPYTWKRVDVTLSKKHILCADKGKNTDIKVRAYRSSEVDIEKLVHRNKWDLRNIDSKLNEIIETEKIQIKKNISGKLLVFEYKSNRTNLLQRTMVTKNNEIIYIIECKSPVKTFYEYEDIFTIAMASFNYLYGESTYGESTNELQDIEDQGGAENEEKTDKQQNEESEDLI